MGLKLSPRLQAIFDHLPENQALWDFCCDHGYLGQAALEADQRGLRNFPAVHFVDSVEHIIASLRARVMPYLDEPKAFFHAIPGEAVEGVVEGAVVIAGVGPSTIEKILRAQTQREEFLPQVLILGPQRDPEKLLLSLDFIKEKFDLHKTLTVNEKGRERKLFMMKRRD